MQNLLFAKLPAEFPHSARARSTAPNAALRIVSFYRKPEGKSTTGFNQFHFLRYFFPAAAAKSRCPGGRRLFVYKKVRGRSPCYRMRTRMTAGMAASFSANVPSTAPVASNMV